MIWQIIKTRNNHSKKMYFCIFHKHFVFHEETQLNIQKLQQKYFFNNIKAFLLNLCLFCQWWALKARHI